MSVLFNQNWIGVNGEPVTGKVPTRVIVRAVDGVQMTRAQSADVYHAYKLFCDAVKVSAFPDGYHVQNRTLADGSRLRMESINGVHKVQLWPVGGKGTDLVMSGIGIAFTLLDGTAVEGWSRTIPKVGGAEGETEVVPQPLILSPVPVAGVKPYVSSGRWRIGRVPELIGGQHLWVSSDRNDWFSTPMEPQYATPFPIAVRNLPTRKYPRNNGDWLKPGSRIFGRNVTTTTPPYQTAEYSLYTFKGGDSVIYKPDGFATPMFAHSTNSGEKRLMAVRSVGDALRVYVGPRRTVKGLHKKDTLDTANYLSPSYIEFARTPPHYFAGGGVEPSPDGKHFVVQTVDTNNGSYCLGTVDEYGDLSLSYDNIALTNTPWHETGSTAVTVSVTTVVPNFVEVTNGPATCPAPGETSGTGTVTGLSVSGTTTTGATTTEVDKGFSSRSESLQSLSYGAGGELVPVIQRTLANGQLTRSASTDGGIRSLSQTSFAEQSVDWVAPKRTLRTSYITHNEVISGGPVASPILPMSIAGAFESTQRTILFYDHDLDFIVYLQDEVHVDLELPASTAWWIEYVGPYSTRTGVTPVRQVSVRAARGTSEVFSFPVSAPVDYQFNNTRGPQSSMFSTSTSVVETEHPYTALGFAQCPGAPDVYYWLQLEAVAEGSITTTTTTFNTAAASFLEQVLPNGRPRPDDYFHVEFARDPRTLALIVNLQFRGADFGHGNSNESWIWAVDQTGVKTLNELLDIDPDAKLIVWEKYNFNSLVSI